MTLVLQLCPTYLSARDRSGTVRGSTHFPSPFFLPTLQHMLNLPPLCLRLLSPWTPDIILLDCTSEPPIKHTALWTVSFHSYLHSFPLQCHHDVWPRTRPRPYPFHDIIPHTIHPVPLTPAYTWSIVIGPYLSHDGHSPYLWCTVQCYDSPWLMPLTDTYLSLMTLLIDHYLMMTHS